MIVCMKTLQQLFKNTLPDMSPNSKIGAKPIPPKKIYDGPATENPQNLREQKTVRRVIALRKP